MTWTLVLSYELQNNALFEPFPLTINYAIHGDSPVWDAYRLSKSRMEWILRDLTKWRMTCRYNTDGLHYTDYVRVSKEKVDPIIYLTDSCVEVEFIDVRGHNCSHCTVVICQKNSLLIHFDSYYSVSRCSFKPAGSLPCGVSGEDNFGYGYGCLNEAHRCASSQTSTTQMWFGGP